PGRYVVPPRPARQQPGQRHLAVLEHVGVVDVEVWGDLLDGELHPGQLLGEPVLQRLDGVQHQVVEDLRLGPGQRHVGRDQPAAAGPARADPATAAGRVRRGGYGWALDWSPDQPTLKCWRRLRRPL